MALRCLLPFASFRVCSFRLFSLSFSPPVSLALFPSLSLSLSRPLTLHPYKRRLIEFRFRLSNETRMARVIYGAVLLPLFILFDFLLFLDPFFLPPPPLQWVPICLRCVKYIFYLGSASQVAAAASAASSSRRLTPRVSPWQRCWCEC